MFFFNFLHKNCIGFFRLVENYRKKENINLFIYQNVIKHIFNIFSIGNLIIYLIELNRKINLRNLFNKKRIEVINDEEKSNDTLIVKDLRKKYFRSKNYVLNDLSFSIKNSECFG